MDDTTTGPSSAFWRYEHVEEDDGTEWTRRNYHKDGVVSLDLFPIEWDGATVVMTLKIGKGGRAELQW